MRTEIEWYQMALRWIYEHGMEKRPIWVNQSLDMAWRPAREGEQPREYPPHEMQIALPSERLK